ncbi:hypothetical protein GUITHDRAFT_101866 [Guillardia theta CCMP2712]|uniref:Nucleotide-diphospho-sugar transferase domain-containing protein n=2 Tax=Guillardia theta TaxID=55529 RepID=L1JWH1_GUITC|nr:hypothetical protein GUITHDRAFT_101866 [Guillardia theta CCMP2712]EKX52712.1 hypothetical protein GUITHDRAFT_101866 [Guillardia theta CCMP2712]|mmetsp:Transcript_36273/g.113213  ORF Transcript_36273/g.113213 Transcript_36273/m.113213 type:complete len:900 (+) Transcript_36273:323-3022(+)|eukprot:XP_005839692.1 hypothetical protein GUITHDRAFT_101866 [Guillardia theta CCMP2712]
MQHKSRHKSDKRNVSPTGPDKLDVDPHDWSLKKTFWMFIISQAVLLYVFSHIICQSDPEEHKRLLMEIKQQFINKQSSISSLDPKAVSLSVGKSATSTRMEAAKPIVSNVRLDPIMPNSQAKNEVVRSNESPAIPRVDVSTNKPDGKSSPLVNAPLVNAPLASKAEQPALAAAPKVQLEPSLQVAPASGGVRAPDERAKSGQGVFRLMVLTCNRPEALKRLLASLKGADYMGRTANLHVFQDLLVSGTADADTKKILQDFQWPFGSKNIDVARTRQGLLLSFVNAWKPSGPADDNDVAIFFEDDIQVSPFFAKWYLEAHERFRYDASVCVFSAMRAQLRASDPHGEGELGNSLPGDVNVFKYRLVGTTSLSPLASQWIEFRTWFEQASKNPNFSPVVEGIQPTIWYLDLKNTGNEDKMWVMWYIKFMSDRNYYCVYPWIPSRHALVAKWNDADARAGNQLFADNRLVDSWDRNLVVWPSYVPTLDWNGHDKMLQPQVLRQRLSCDGKTSTLNLPKLQAAMQGMPKDVVILHFINSAFMPFMLSWLCNTQQMTGVHERTLVITTDAGSEERVKRFSSRVHAMYLEGYNGINGNLDFDSLGYRRMLKARIEIIISVLQKSDLLFLTEPDAIWMNNLLEIKEFVNSPSDLIGFDDEQGGKGAGFVLMRNNAAISCLWRKLLERQELTLAPYEGQPNEIVTYDDNDQKYFNALIQDMEAAGMMKSSTMDTCKFRTGKWYKREEWKDYMTCLNIVPDILNFNWMVGNQPKIQRAKLYGHWFLEEDGQTCKPIQETLARAKTSFTGGFSAGQVALPSPQIPFSQPAIPGNNFAPSQFNFAGQGNPSNSLGLGYQPMVNSQQVQQGGQSNNPYGRFRINPAVHQRINSLLAERFRRVGSVRHSTKR